MRLVALLIAVLVVGMLVYKQLGQSPTSSSVPSATGESSEVPRVPTTVQEIKPFETEINDFMQDEAARRAQMIEDAEAQ